MLGPLADRIFDRLGYVLMRHSKFAQVRGTLDWSRLSSIPISPKTIIDVGVAYGTPELYDAFPESALVLIEPLAEYAESIQSVLRVRRGIHFPNALGSVDGDLVINVEAEPVMSSFLPRTPEAAARGIPQQRLVPVRRLDTLLATTQLVRPIGLKIDVEGFELEVVRGAKESLRAIAFVIVETSIGARFEGGPSFADLVSEMRASGFELYDIVSISRLEGPGARHADLLFLNTQLS